MKHRILLILLLSLPVCAAGAEHSMMFGGGNGMARVANDAYKSSLTTQFGFRYTFPAPVPVAIHAMGVYQSAFEHKYERDTEITGSLHQLGAALAWDWSNFGLEVGGGNYLWSLQASYRGSHVGSQRGIDPFYFAAGNLYMARKFVIRASVTRYQNMSGTDARNLTVMFAYRLLIP